MPICPSQVRVAFGGPDRCGKSNIIAALSHVIDVPTFKASSEHETFLKGQDLFVQQLRFADTRMVDLIKQVDFDILLDRAWCCEFAYSYFYGRPTDLKALRFVDSAMAELGTKVVICYRSNYDNIVDDLSPLLRGQKLAQIEQEYRRFARWTKCPVHFLNVDDEDLYREVSEVLKFIGYNEEYVKYAQERITEHLATL